MSSKKSWKLQEFMAHEANVNCLSLGQKSGRVLVTGGDDKKVNLWAVGKDCCIMSLSGHTAPVECVKFDAPEEYVVAGSSAGALKVWDLEAVKMLRTFTGHKAGIRSIDFHPYGNNLVSGSLDTTVKLWDTRYKGHICTYTVHRQTVNSVKFSPDGQWVASGGEDGLVKILDLRTRKVVSEFAEHAGSVTSVEYHPHEFLLCSSSTDRTVKFWELENFSLISTFDRDSMPIRCILFHPNGQCLYAGAQDMFKVYTWEPKKTVDSIPISWGKIQDIAIANTQLVGASFHLTNVLLWVVDLNKVSSRNDSSASASSSHFGHGQSTRKSFSKKTSPESSKTKTVSEKTIEETVDLTESDQEDVSVAAILNVKDYKSIFQPNRALTRSPPLTFPAPTSDEDLSLTHPNITTNPAPTINVESPMSEPSLSSLSPPPQSPVFSDSGSRKMVQRVASPTLTTTTRPVREQLRRYSSCRDPDLSPTSDSDFPVTLSSIQHSPSEPSLARYSHSRTNSVGKHVDMQRPVNSNNSTKTEMLNSVNNSNTRSSTLNKPSGIDFQDFLPQKSFGNKISQMSESMMTNSILYHHENMMTVLKQRSRSLQIVYQLWKNKDLKSAMDYAVELKDMAVIVDLLDVFIDRPSDWNLDICVILLPPIFELIQSKYERYMTVGCSALKLILRTFSPVIRTNIMRPGGSLGVDISREERYNKCVKCYNSLLPIRAFILKRQTMQGKLGQNFRELHLLLQELGSNEV